MRRENDTSLQEKQFFPAVAAGITTRVFPTVAVGIQVKYCRVLHMLPLLLWENLLLHYTSNLQLTVTAPFA
jgi:hypothetical protein